MTILVLSDLWVPFPGGAERLMFNLARDLMRRGEDVTVLTGYEAAMHFDGPPVESAAIGVFDTRADGAAIVTAAIAELTPDVILTHHLYARQFEGELAATKIPVVQVVLNGQRSPVAELAVFISQWVMDRGLPQPGDLLITPVVFPDVVAARHGDAIGFIKPIDHKGVDLFYEIAALLPDRRFVVLRGEWQDLEVIQPAPNITFMEPVVDMRDFYAEVGLLLVPSKSEDAGTVAQEATMNGLPCISTDVDGLAETNGGGLRLAPNPHLWAKAIESLLTEPDRYAFTVARQRDHLAATDQAGRLDAFAAAIAELSARSPASTRR